MWWNSASCLNGSEWLFCFAVMLVVAMFFMGVCFFFRKKMGMLGCCGQNSHSCCGDFFKLDTKDKEQNK